MNELLQYINPGILDGFVLPVILAALFFATFVSEDAACLAAGALVSNGRIGFAAAVGACLLGILAGDIALYWTGRVFGRKVVEMRFFSRVVSVSSLDRASEWLEKRGAYAVFLSRFVTGLRLPTYLAAGLFRTDFLKFAGYFLLAATIWTPLLVGSAAFSQMVFSQNILAGLVAAFVVLRLTTKLSSWKNRRLFVGRIKRIVNWEFWPVQVFYLPVVVYTVFLAIKHRSLTVFTCVNPAIFASGFTGESKNEIYAGLGGSRAADGFLLRHALIEGGERGIKEARKFVKDNNLSYPVVLKPDSGERGKGVGIMHTPRQLEEAIASGDGRYILQEYFGGPEASIFYYRYPGEEKGRIFSITEKRFPHVAGDGAATLEELILSDPRAVCLAKSYLMQNSERLEMVPAAGERVQIIDIGTHSRGAIFLDGGWLYTPELEQRVDEICRGFKGFYFGRFDIRCATFDDLRRGRNFKVIELNGVTSESTNIYDPRYTLIDAYRILFRQWHIAFEIGAENYQTGADPTPVRDLCDALLVSKAFSEASSLIAL